MPPGPIQGEWTIRLNTGEFNDSPRLLDVRSQIRTQLHKASRTDLGYSIRSATIVARGPVRWPPSHVGTCDIRELEDFKLR